VTGRRQPSLAVSNGLDDDGRQRPKADDSGPRAPIPSSFDRECFNGIRGSRPAGEGGFPVPSSAVEPARASHAGAGAVGSRGAAA
jgi:hypothetical protein